MHRAKALKTMPARHALASGSVPNPSTTTPPVMRRVSKVEAPKIHAWRAQLRVTARQESTTTRCRCVHLRMRVRTRFVWARRRTMHVPRVRQLESAVSDFISIRHAMAKGTRTILVSPVPPTPSRHHCTHLAPLLAFYLLVCARLHSLAPLYFPPVPQVMRTFHSNVAP